MDMIVLILLALGGAFLSFFSGFGLGTLLLPGFLLFFEPPIAIAATAIVHMANNLFKLFLVGRYADWSIIKAFGFTSVIGALLGAGVLSIITTPVVVLTYNIGESQMVVTLLNFLVGVTIMVFAGLELSLEKRPFSWSKKSLVFGGLISGFFGGMTGHQGALRSAFLMKAGLSKEAFMGSRVVLAILVDLTRIATYFAAIKAVGVGLVDAKLIGACLAAFLGAFIGNKVMQKKQWDWINRFIRISLVLFGMLLISGVI